MTALLTDINLMLISWRLVMIFETQKCWLPGLCYSCIWWWGW
jgi:hypothetical protein